MLKVVFAGTPEFSATILQGLLDARTYNIIRVLTQPDRPKGRGQKLEPSPVKTLAKKYNLPILQPATLKRSSTALDTITTLQPDLLIVVAYGLILPAKLLSIPTFGCINVHASILPKWRGAAPIQHAILAGDTKTGITIMQMDQGLDTGDILATYPCDILATDTSYDLQLRLADLGKQAILDALKNLNKLQPTPQDHSQASYAPKITKQQANLDWDQPAQNLERAIRAYQPWPMAFTYLGKERERVRIWQANAIQTTQTSTAHKPGTICDISPTGINVATGGGVLQILRMQFPGKKPLHIKDILHANNGLGIGVKFSNDPAV